MDMGCHLAFRASPALLVALAAGAWNSEVRSLRACRSCDELCYMPSISIGEGERQGAQKTSLVEGGETSMQ